MQVNGVLTVNAMRASISTNIVDTLLGQTMPSCTWQRGQITVANGGALHCIGLFMGRHSGAMSGSIYEPMFIKSFRGGTATSRVGLDVFHLINIPSIILR